MQLSGGHLLEGAGLEDVRRDSGLYVALWRGGADAWRGELAMGPLTPQALGSHALLAAMHPEGVEVVFGEHGTDRLLLADNSAVLVPTSSRYRLESRSSDPRLLVVVGMREDSGAGHQGPDPHAGEMRRRATKVTWQGRSSRQRRSGNRARRRCLRMWT